MKTQKIQYRIVLQKGKNVIYRYRTAESLADAWDIAFVVAKSLKSYNLNAVWRCKKCVSKTHKKRK